MLLILLRLLPHYLLLTTNTIMRICSLTLLATTDVCHILSVLKIISWNRYALVPSFLQRTNSVVKNCCSSWSISPAYNVLIISKFASLSIPSAYETNRSHLVLNLVNMIMGDRVLQTRNFWLLPVLTYLILCNSLHIVVCMFVLSNGSKPAHCRMKK